MPGFVRQADGPGSAPLPAFAALWAETWGRFVASLPLMLPVAGALLFLPQLIVQRFAMASGAPAQGLSPAVLLGLGVLLAGQLLAQLFASLTVVGRPGQTVGEALGLAARRAPAGLAASFLQSLALLPSLPLLASSDPGLRLLGLLLFLPGTFVALRLMLALPAIADRGDGPLAALERAWRLSSGRVGPILGQTSLVLLGLILVFLVASGLAAALAAIGTLADGGPSDRWSVGRWLSALVTAATASGITVLFAQFVAVLYRHLAR